MIVHKSRKKAVRITVAGFLAGIAGGLILYCVRDVVLGWCFVATAGFTLLYGIGSLYDRRPYIVLTEDGITEMFTIRGQIEWEAIRYADDFYFRGQYWVRLLLESNYKPQLIRPAWFWRFDRLYESKGVKAVYLRTMGLEIDSMQLVALIRRMKEADVPGRIELLNGCLLKYNPPQERRAPEFRSRPSAGVLPCLFQGKHSAPAARDGRAGNMLRVIV